MNRSRRRQATTTQITHIQMETVSYRKHVIAIVFKCLFFSGLLFCYCFFFLLRVECSESWL